MPPLPQKLPSLCIFDWDHTLVDNYAAIHRAINAARGAFDMPAWTLEETRLYCRRALKETFPEWFGKDWERAAKIYYQTFEATHLECLQIMPGADAVLAKLKSAGIPMAVNSNKNAGYLRTEIAHLRWGAYFRAIVGAGDASKGKPAPDGVNLIRQQVGVSVDALVWYVGDTVLDYETAVAGKCLPIILGPEGATLTNSDQIPLGNCKELLDFIKGILEQNHASS